MTQESIISTLIRHGADVKHYGEVYDSFPAGEWFTPTNQQDQSYTVCMHLHEMGILGMKRSPIWKNGSYCGVKIEFIKIN